MRTKQLAVIIAALLMFMGSIAAPACYATSEKASTQQQPIPVPRESLLALENASLREQIAQRAVADARRAFTDAFQEMFKTAGVSPETHEFDPQTNTLRPKAKPPEAKK